MAVTIATPVEEQWLEMFRVDARGFGFVPEPGDAELRRPIIDLSRFRVAVDRGAIVGVAGSYGFDMTLSGGAAVPMSGVTWVSVSATHRRQGVVTRLLDACHADSDARGEPVAALFASEGGIYERFGYGIATQMRVVAVDRRQARLRPDLPVDPHAVRFEEGDVASAHRRLVWDAFWRRQPGQVSRSSAWHDHQDALLAKPRGEASPAFCMVHDDGYALYRIVQRWTDDGPAHRLDVVDLVALTPAAHLDLWRAIVGVDLVETIQLLWLPAEDPLPYYFTDNRVVRTKALGDGLWVHVRDVAACFASRAYGTAERMVIELDGARWAIDGGPDGASCRRVRTRPDLVLDRPSAGALLLGGVRPSALAAARRISARSANALRRADVFFPSTPPPHCQTMF